MIGAGALGIIAVMNNHTARALVALALMTAAHPLEGLAVDAAEKAASVLAAARAALGGEEKLRGVKTLQAAGDWRRSMGDMDIQGELELMLERPDRMRRNESVEMPGGATMIRTEVLNGAEVWDDTSNRGGMGGHVVMTMRGPGGRDMSPEEVNELRRRARRADLTRYLLAWLLATDAPVTYAGVAEAPDGKADVLEITPEGAPPMRLFIDQGTRLPLMLTWRGPQPRMLVRRMGGGPPPADASREAPGEPPAEAAFEMRFDDYREVDGIRLPHQITRAVNGAVNEEWTVKSFKLNAPLKSSTFVK
jgi:hypothetical protein